MFSHDVFKGANFVFVPRPSGERVRVRGLAPYLKVSCKENSAKVKRFMKHDTSVLFLTVLYI